MNAMCSFSLNKQNQFKSRSVLREAINTEIKVSAWNNEKVLARYYEPKTKI